jgi:hypothetical protein
MRLPYASDPVDAADDPQQHRARAHFDDIAQNSWPEGLISGMSIRSDA